MAKAPWAPLDLKSLPDCEIISCDPSLTALGLVWFSVASGTVTVHGAQKLATVPTERKGWDDTFFRADLMESQLDALIDQWLDKDFDMHRDRSKVMAVHEAPPTGGGDFVRIEATVLTGKSFRSVVTDWKLPILQLVTPQSHKKLLTGNHLATKKEYAEHINRLLPDITGGNLVKNEATRDALGIGLYAAKRFETDKSTAK